ncbi:MAG: hypothetical protein PHE32_00985 [Candidatus Shapirobacteria bacterium]|nr:hypothetical protein [Candidatus Shapirobacteria bacterium]MDD4410267.1 hypothetical protein [Candidatus Shapirobacteria bacterium]
MKKIQIQLMDDDLRTLVAAETKEILNSLGFRYIEYANSHYDVSVRIKDLPKIKKLNGFHLLDDNSTEISMSDIQKIFIQEEMYCE